MSKVRLASRLKDLARGFAKAVREPPAQEQVEKTLRTVAKRHGMKTKVHVPGYMDPLESYAAPASKTIAIPAYRSRGKTMHALVNVPVKGAPEVVVGASRMAPERTVSIGLHELGHAIGKEKGSVISKVRNAFRPVESPATAVGQAVAAGGAVSGLPVAAVAGAGAVVAAQLPKNLEEARASLWALSRSGEASKVLGKKLKFRDMAKAQASYPALTTKDVAVPLSLGAGVRALAGAL